jgi:farnesyl diphosphate synthase
MNANSNDFANRLAAAAGETESVLNGLLNDQALPGEIARPQHLLAAMRHASSAAANACVRFY